MSTEDFETERLDEAEFEKLPKDSKLKVLRKEREKWEDYWRDNVQTSRACNNFIMNAYGGAQYDKDTADYYNRVNKPMLSFNKLYVPILQTEGEYRQLSPQVEVVCYDPEVEQDQVNLRADYIRGKMYDQNGEQINIKNFRNALCYGYSVALITTDYMPNNPFEQDIIIDSLDDPTTAYFDPIAKKPSKEDGRFCGYVKYEDIEVLKAKYPKKDIDKQDYEDKYLSNKTWYDSEDNLCAVCYHWKKSWCKEMWYLLSDGQSVNENKWEDLNKEKKNIKKQLKQIRKLLISGSIGINDSIMGTSPLGNQQPQYSGMQQQDPQQMMIQQYMQIAQSLEEYLQEFPKIVEEKEVSVPEVKFYKFIATEILEEGEFKFDTSIVKDALPLIYIDGDSYLTDSGKQGIRPICIDGIDTQKLINYEQSTKAFKLKTTHQTKIMITQERWKDSVKESLQHPEESGVMIVGDSANPNAPMPMPVPESSFPAMLADMAAKDEQQLQTIIGRFDAAFGNDAKEVSGVAYGKKVGQSNLASYKYFSNNFYGISHLSKVMLAMMPTILDNERMISGLDDSKNLKFYKINESENNQIGNNADKFDVYITVGSTFQEQKQQRMQEILAFMQSASSMPQIFSLLGDVLAKSLNNDYAPEILKRVKEFMLDPKVKAELEGKPQPPTQPPQPSPKEQADMAKAQSQIVSSQVKAKAEMYKADAEIEKAKLEATRTSINALEEHEHKHLRTENEMLKNNLI